MPSRTRTADCVPHHVDRLAPGLIRHSAFILNRPFQDQAVRFDAMTFKTKRVPIYMAVLTYLPLLLIGGGLLLAMHAPTPLGAIGLFAAWLYLLPPLLGRLVLLRGVPVCAAAAPTDAAFRRWWLLTQLQMPFNRVAVLEELLRLVPGLYSLWLNLWGARVSLMTFWSRDVLISERYLLTIEPGVTVAGQVGLIAHLVAPDESGELRLQLAPVVIEAGAMLGIRSGLGPGCRVFAGELLPAGRLLPPHTGWRDGRKVRLPSVEPE